MADEAWYVYLLECKSKRIYTGVTPDLNNRLEAHSKGKGALFTKINTPEKLLAAKLFSSRRQALQVEKQIALSSNKCNFQIMLQVNLLAAP